ncbi:MAG: hypothetical protein F4X26_04250 [Chloroflexi bacterium]|nr:hypothetical protein [Chloroflexota bacterium]
MRFKLDENVPVTFGRLLADAGHDVATVVDEGLVGAADEVIAEACVDEQRALVTQDLDFADIRAYPPAEYAGLVVLRPRTSARDAVLAIAPTLMQRLESASRAGQLWIVESERLRIRE